MKKYLFILGIALAGTAFFAFRAADIETIAIGATAPKTDLKMKTTTGKSTTLAEQKKANGLLVVFSCNGCPFVVGSDGSEGWEGRYPELKRLSDQNNVGMILLNSNEGKRSSGDSMDDMKAHAKEKGYENIIYALDQDSELANAFGARTTPHVFLFDKDMKLVYKGAIDDNVASASKVAAHYLSDALGNLSAGKAINPAETKPVGCSIKRPS